MHDICEHPYTNYESDLERLIKGGADVNARDNDGKTPLHYASKLDVVKHLVEHGADVNARDNNGRSPLTYVCEYAQKDYQNSMYIIEYLLKHGADVNAKNNNNDTPLMYACNPENMKVFEYLLEQYKFLFLHNSFRIF